VMVFAACAVAILLIDPEGSRTWAFRDALLLATAGAMAARNTPHFFRVFSKVNEVSERTVRVIELEQLAGVFVLLMVSAYYRPGGQLVNWQLPGTAWLFVTFGIGATMGLFVYFALTKINKDPQFTAVLLGSIAFMAGMASFLRLSPLAVCAIAGVITANLGGPWKEQMAGILERLERPVYFLFMVLAGALWHPSEWQGWVLMVVFIVSRLGSRWFASEVARRAVSKDLTDDERRSTAWAPMGALSVAIVVSAQDLYSGPTISWIVTAVIAGALLSEVGLQFAASRARASGGGPVYSVPGSGGVD
jgi:Kef-type K+ transport system membrane component KefB